MGVQRETRGKNLLEQFKAATLAPYGIAGKENCIAAGALIEYLKETQKRSLDNVSSVELYDRNEFLTLDSIAVRNLELVKTTPRAKIRLAAVGARSDENGDGRPSDAAMAVIAVKKRR